MNGKERTLRILKGLPVDRIGLFEHFWGDTYKDWAEKGIKTPSDTEKEEKPAKELNPRVPKTRFSSYAQHGSYSDDELDALVLSSSVKVMNKED